MACDMISDPKAIRSFCDAAERLYPQVVIETTANSLGLYSNQSDMIEMTEAIIKHIESTPAYEDDIADAKLLLREMIEEAFFEIYPNRSSAMGIKLPLVTLQP